MKKLAVLFVLLISLIFVACADVPDFPNNQQVVSFLQEKEFVCLPNQIYFVRGEENLLFYSYPQISYVNKFGDENNIEFNYICVGYYKSRPDSVRTILVKLFRKGDMPNIGKNLDGLKIVWEL